jgi:hypothetical protein
VVKDTRSNGNGGHQERDCYCHKHHNASIFPHDAVFPSATPQLTVIPDIGKRPTRESATVVTG